MTGEKPYEIMNALTVSSCSLPLTFIGLTPSDNSQNESNAHGQYVYQKPASQRTFNAAAAYSTFQILVKCTETGMRAMIGFALNNTAKICSVPSDATAYYNRGQRVDVITLVRWDKDAPGKTDEARRIAKLLVDAIVQNEEKPMDATRVMYGNIGASYYLRSDHGETDRAIILAGEETTAPDAARKLFGGNYPRLQQLKKKYDPDLVFSTWHPITPEN